MPARRELGCATGADLGLKLDATVTDYLTTPALLFSFFCPRGVPVEFVSEGFVARHVLPDPQLQSIVASVRWLSNQLVHWPELSLRPNSIFHAPELPADFTS